MGEFYFNAAQVSTASGAARFDGTWDVSLDCPDQTEGKTVARGYVFRFYTEVKDGVLHGQRGAKGTPGSLTLEGKIQPNGTADLNAKGFTAEPEYAGKNVRPGTPYGYRATARFEDSRGTGSRVEGRTCNFSFVKK